MFYINRIGPNNIFDTLQVSPICCRLTTFVDFINGIPLKKRLKVPKHFSIAWFTELLLQLTRFDWFDYNKKISILYKMYFPIQIPGVFEDAYKVIMFSKRKIIFILIKNYQIIRSFRHLESLMGVCRCDPLNYVNLNYIFRSGTIKSTFHLQFSEVSLGRR